MKLCEINMMLAKYLKCYVKVSCAEQGDKDCRWVDNPSKSLKQRKACMDSKLLLDIIKHSQENDNE